MPSGMVLAEAPARTLGTRERPRLAFGEAQKPAEAHVGLRVLLLDDEPAFELSFWCGTCPYLFERLQGANGTLSLTELTDRLAEGLDDLDDEVIGKFASLLPLGEYVPMLLEVRPRLVRPGAPGDYFSEEQVATWGVDSFWGLPEYPQTPYYRTFDTAVEPDAHLYEFVVPMVPPSWNDSARVAEFAARPDGATRATAVAVSTLDVCLPAVDHGRDWHAHWGLTHFLLDGHHKLEAAATRDRPLRLLSLLSLAGSLATPEQVARVPELRGRPAAGRPAAS